MRTPLFLSLALATVSPLLAGPQSEVVPEEAPAALEVAEPAVSDLIPGDVKAKAPGFLGVTGSEISAALAQQLKLDHGVTLLSVSPGSPAAMGGLEVNDIITDVGGKKVATILELRDAIRAHQEGEEVTLKLVQKGKPVEKKVTLAAAPEVAARLVPQGALQIFPGAGWQGGNLQLRLGGGGRGGLFRRGDLDGSVEMKGSGEGREVRVWDLAGEVIFEGPWVTPQDKAAAPPTIRKRIERVSGMLGRPQVLPLGGGFVIPPQLDLRIEPQLEVPVPQPAPAPKLEDGELEEGEPEEDLPEKDE